MPDKDKFMYAAICFGNDARHDCRECDYYIRTNCVEYCDERRIVRDALELLKEQEAVEPKTEPSAKGYWYTCGVCGWWLFEVRDTVRFDDRKRIHFCASCGRSVKWE